MVGSVFNEPISRMAYVDLNPVSAKICDQLEDSQHTSITQRIESAGQGGLEASKPEPITPLRPVAGVQSDLQLSITEAESDLIRWNRWSFGNFLGARVRVRVREFEFLWVRLPLLVTLTSVGARCATCYNSLMIKSFRHKGLKRFYSTCQTSGIQPDHAKKLRLQLAALDTANSVEDMDIPGFRLHPLKGQDKGRWSIRVNGNWRMTFEFQDGNAYILDYEDYH